MSRSAQNDDVFDYIIKYINNGHSRTGSEINVMCEARCAKCFPKAPSRLSFGVFMSPETPPILPGKRAWLTNNSAPAQQPPSRL